jgi:mevalonate kinase
MIPHTVLGSGQAPGKTIIFGEHFVVHGSPALAVPVTGITTQVTVARGAGEGLELILDGALSGHARVQATQVIEAAIARVGAPSGPVRLTVTSSIPAGFGLGSSAALAVALVRALSRSVGHELSSEAVREHAHALEGLVHGAPSGLDDTVVSYALPIRFRRGVTPVPVVAGAPFTWVLGAVGYAGSTFDAVASVGRLKASEPVQFAARLSAVESAFARAFEAFERGDHVALGIAMNRTHGFLQEIGVSTPELDAFVDAARDAGALGAKLTGAGWGGFMVALAPPGGEAAIVDALTAKGASPVLLTRV